ncbi:MAG: ATP-binding cassette domain-containing protein [Spirochaetes bacterium]|nr:ATP-binding cassette domain-containing protein [Spirochaetota bacterium]MBU1082316.1 ATP-binding cassette domain-containing protein [Spirochaetota bacterium]
MPEGDSLVPAIELRDVTASSGGFQILSGASVAFPEGLCSVVMGAAGSGKSTLLKVAAGLVVPDSGAVSVGGSDLARLTRKEELSFRATTGFVFQDAALWADTNILGNVAMPLRVHKPWMGESTIAEAARVVLHKLGYDEGMALRPAELSSGEQKLVSIARAVVNDPAVVFMDDPTSNLDEDAAEKVYELLAELKQKRRTVIIVANSSELAYRFADRLGVIKGGSMAAFGTYDETVGRAEAALSGSLARLRARGSRAAARSDGAENSQRGDV